MIDYDNIQISDLELSDYNGYKLTELQKAQKFNDNTLFVVANEDLSTSNNLKYSILSSQIMIDVINGLGIKSMAFQEKYKYSISSHTHDQIYSKVNIHDTLICTDEGMQLLADFYVDNNNEISTSSMRMPVIKYDGLRIPVVGELRFIGCNDFSQFETIEYPDGTFNINVSSEDYDGWVFPNGTHLDEYDIDIPDLRHFLKINNGYQQVCSNKFVDYHNTVLEHNHGTKEREYYLTGDLHMYKCYIPTSAGCGVSANIAHHGSAGTSGIDADFDIDCSTFKFSGIYTDMLSDEIDKETKPCHNLMPVMIYLGDISSYYEYAKDIPEIINRKVDIVFLLDVTGSMSSCKKLVSDKINQIIDEFQNINIDNMVIIDDWTIGAGAFGDCTCDSPWFQFKGLKTDKKQIKEDINGLMSTGGGDGPETPWHAVVELQSVVKWRSDAMKVIVVITDVESKGCENIMDVIEKQDLRITLISPDIEKVIIDMGENGYQIKDRPSKFFSTDECSEILMNAIKSTLKND